jgi:hypothetical protein
VPIKKEKQPLSVTHPELAKEADGWDPGEITAGSHKSRKWKCTKEHSWTADISNRAMGDTQCPYCSGRRVLSGFNDLKTKFPLIASEANKWNPSDVLAGSKVKKDWICKKGHSWEATIYSRIRGAACPVCAGNKTLPGFNDLETKFPEIAKEANGWDPTKVAPVSGQLKKWRCPSGHTYSMTVANRTYGHGCSVCSGRTIEIGFNDLLTLNPELSKEADGWNPQSVTSKSNKKKKWKCSLGHSWSATIADRASGHGCPSCSKTGFDPNKDGYLYFLEHESWEMLQVGITNDPDRRLKEHSKLGWSLLEIRGPMEGHLAKNWESSILSMLKSKKADLSNKDIAGKFNGYSEAWSKSSFEAKSIKQLMQLTEEFEEGR